MSRRGIIVGLLAGLGGAVLAFSAVMAHVITSPRRRPDLSLPEHVCEVEEVSFRTGDGLLLHGWYFPHPAPRDAIVISHGFMMDRAELLAVACGLQTRGHATLLFDFRAHGRSEGRRTTIGYHEAVDVRAAVGWLAARPELAGCAIGALGLSMGAAATLHAAAQEPRIRAVVADSAFATLGDIAAGGLRLLYRLPSFPFVSLIIGWGELLTGSKIRHHQPIAVVATIAPRPILFIHSAQDRLVPLANAQRVYRRAGTPKDFWVVPELGHAQAHDRLPEEYLERIERFFRTWLPASTSEHASVADY